MPDVFGRLYTLNSDYSFNCVRAVKILFILFYSINIQDIANVVHFV